MKKLRIPRSKRWVPRHQIRFQGFSESLSEEPSPPREPAGAAGAGTPSLRFPCPRSTVDKTLSECLSCRFFVDLRPGPRQALASLRCVCRDGDPILRSADTRRAWLTVGPDTSIRTADRLCKVHNVAALPVLRGAEVLGVVYREDLAASDGLVAGCMTQYPWALSTRATLGDAVEAFRATGVSSLLVLTPDAALEAIVSVAQLARLGVPATLLSSPCP